MNIHSISILMTCPYPYPYLLKHWTWTFHLILYLFYLHINDIFICMLTYSNIEPSAPYYIYPTFISIAYLYTYLFKHQMVHLILHLFYLLINCTFISVCLLVKISNLPPCITSILSSHQWHIHICMLTYENIGPPTLYYIYLISISIEYPHLYAYLLKHQTLCPILYLYYLHINSISLFLLIKTLNLPCITSISSSHQWHIHVLMLTYWNIRPSASYYIYSIFISITYSYSYLSKHWTFHFILHLSHLQIINRASDYDVIVQSAGLLY